MTQYKKIDLSNYVLQVCQRFYSTLDNLSKNLPKENYDIVSDAYENKINSLKIDLTEKDMLTEEVEKTLQEIVLNIKSGESDKCIKNIGKLEKELYKKTKTEGEKERHEKK